MSYTQYIPYGVVALLCAVALLRFSVNLKQYAPDTVANRFYRIAIVASAVCALMEFLFVFHESGMFINPVYCYFTEITYSMASLAAGFFWFMCSETEQQAKTVSTHFCKIICAVPFLIMMILDFTTPWHHLLFSFTADGHYMRGIFSNFFVIITAVYIGKSGLFALVKSFRRKNYLNRSKYLTFFYYALGIVVAQVFQIGLGSVLPFRVIGAAVVFYIVQEQAIKANVFNDILTDANNRTAMNHYLKLNFENAGENFTFVMIDIDDFKKINDRYGHNTGDTVLYCLADAFKKTIPSSLFFGRFGGDEFVLIGKVDSDDEINNIMKWAALQFREQCETENIEVCPVFSYGVSHKTAEIKSIPDLINQADAAMYENKRLHKALK